MAALPCLRTEKEKRHVYQEEIAEHLSALFANAEAARRHDVTQIEEQHNTVTKEHAEAMGRAEAARESATVAKERVEHLGMLADAAEKAVETGKAECVAEHEKHGLLLQRAAEIATQKAGLQKIASDLLRPLAAGEVPGSQWRRRDRMCQELVECLRPLGLEESLALALTPALKEKVQQRGVFANKAVGFASDLLAENINKILHEIASLDSEAAQQLQNEGAAKAEVENLRATWNARVEEYIAIQNEWADKQTFANKEAESVESFAPRFQEVEQMLEAAKLRLETFSASMSKFAQLKENGVRLEHQTLGQAQTADAMV